MEQESKVRAEIERRLASQIAVATKDVETKLDELGERIESQGRVICSQQKEIQVLKAQREATASRNRRAKKLTEQFATLAKQIEGLKEDTRHFLAR